MSGSDEKPLTLNLEESSNAMLKLPELGESINREETGRSRDSRSPQSRQTNYFNFYPTNNSIQRISHDSFDEITPFNHAVKQRDALNFSSMTRNQREKGAGRPRRAGTNTDGRPDSEVSSRRDDDRPPSSVARRRRQLDHLTNGNGNGNVEARFSTISFSLASMRFTFVLVIATMPLLCLFIIKTLFDIDNCMYAPREGSGQGGEECHNYAEYAQLYLPIELYSLHAGSLCLIFVLHSQRRVRVPLIVLYLSAGIVLYYFISSVIFYPMVRDGDASWAESRALILSAICAMAILIPLVGAFLLKQGLYLRMYFMTLTFMSVVGTSFYSISELASEASSNGVMDFIILVFPFARILFEAAFLYVLAKFDATNGESYPCFGFITRSMLVAWDAFYYALLLYPFYEANSYVVVMSLLVRSLCEVCNRVRLIHLCSSQIFEEEPMAGLVRTGTSREDVTGSFREIHRLYHGHKFEAEVISLWVILIITLLDWVPFPQKGNHADKHGTPDDRLTPPIWLLIFILIMKFFVDILCTMVARCLNAVNQVQIQHFEYLGEAVLVTMSNLGTFMLVFLALATAFQQFNP